MKGKITLVLLLCMTLFMVACLRPGERQLIKGNEYFDKGRWSEAITEYTEAIEKSTGTENNPILLTAYTNRAESYFYINNIDQAIADSTKAIEVDPLSVIPYLNRSKYYIYNDEYDKAIADCNKVLELGLQSAFVYFNRAVANTKLGNYEEALDDFNKALEISTDEVLNQRINEYIKEIEKNM
jgi:tetratricopeptide (TPR) repeat protein